jgi:hypothetical protein
MVPKIWFIFKAFAPFPVAETIACARAIRFVYARDPEGNIIEVQEERARA